MWFFLALLGYAALAVVLLLDKFILTKSVERPEVYTFYSTVFLCGALIAWPFGVDLLVGVDWLWATISGLSFGFGLWTMFIAVKKEEASRINPFIGAMTAISTYVCASVFLGEHLSSAQQIGIVFLILSTIVFVYSKERARGMLYWGTAFSWALLSGILFALSHITAKYLYMHYTFLTGFVWTRSSIALVALFTLFYPSVRGIFRKKKKERPALRKELRFGHKHAVKIVVTDKLLGIVSVIFIQYAIAVGSVTVVNALVGAQYALLFLLIWIVSKRAPTYFHERITRREALIEGSAIILVLIGSSFLAF